MNREVPLDRRSARGQAVVQPCDHRRPMDTIVANAAKEMIVRVGVVAEQQAVQRRRSPVAPDSPERQFAVLPLSAHIAAFGARVDRPRLTAAEAGTDIY